MKPFPFLAWILFSSAIFTAPVSAQAVSSSDSSATQTPFADVPANHWAAPAVKKLAELGIIEGFPAQVPADLVASKVENKPMTAAKTKPKVMSGKTVSKPNADFKRSVTTKRGSR